MTIQLHTALSAVNDAAARLFEADPRVRSVGVGASADGYEFVAVRNIRAAVPFQAVLGGDAAPTQIEGIPVVYVNSQMDPSNLAEVPHSGPGSPGVGSIIPEQQAHSPLVCGLQLQNIDDDMRTGLLAKGYMTVGSLGCFVVTQAGDIAILSNNHVLAGQNRGIQRSDRILHPGGFAFQTHQHCATLDKVVSLLPSPPGATIAAGTVVLNDVDAAMATLLPGQSHSQVYLAGRNAAAPRGFGAAQIGDKVHKVGRTTGLQFGTVTQIGVTTGPISYAPGPCWFQLSIVIEGDNGTTFSDHGDSGSAIVRDDGTVIGLLYAGNGTQTYACPIANVLALLNCHIA